MEMLRSLRAGSSRPTLRRLSRRLARKHQREAERLRRELGREDVGRLGDEVRRVGRRSAHAQESWKAAEIRRAAREAGKEALARLHESRLAVDPMDLDTVHRMRIALKKFRYLLEALRPLFPVVGEHDLESLHKLQTTMGDLHDLEVLSSTLSRHVEKLAPASAAPFAPTLATLEKRHSAMLGSFLQGVDPILDAWEPLLRGAAARRRTHRAPH
jgi:CHAD domain-containing protein